MLWLKRGMNKLPEKKNDSAMHGDVDMTDVTADRKTESVRSGGSRSAPAPTKPKWAQRADFTKSLCSVA